MVDTTEAKMKKLINAILQDKNPEGVANKMGFSIEGGNLKTIGNVKRAPKVKPKKKMMGGGKVKPKPKAKTKMMYGSKVKKRK
jgi:hypothetical protein